MEGFVDPLLGHHDDGDDVDDDADDGDDEARRTVDPKLQPEVFFTLWSFLNSVWNGLGILCSSAVQQRPRNFEVVGSNRDGLRAFLPFLPKVPSKDSYKLRKIRQIMLKTHLITSIMM